MLIADADDHVIREVDRTTGVIRTIAGTERIACSASPCGDGQAATSARLNTPTAVAVDAAGDVLIADQADDVVREVNRATGVIRTIAGTERAGCSVSPCGDGGAATGANLNTPTGVAVDGAGDVLIADTGDDVVREVNHTTRAIDTIAGTERAPCSASPCGEGGTASGATLNAPRGLAVDAAGDVLVADTGDDVVREVNQTTGVIRTVAGTERIACSASPCGDGGAATSAVLNTPKRVAVDAAGDVLIGDTDDDVVREVNHTTGLITTIAGTERAPCSASPCGDGGGGTSAALTAPHGVAVDAAGEVLIADTGDQTVRLLMGPQARPTGPTGATGPQGPPRKLELVTCTKIKKRKKTVRQCTARVVTGTFPAKGVDRASLWRGRTVYATGEVVGSRHGVSELLLVPKRALRPGRYTLTTRARVGKRLVMRRAQITIR